MLELVQSAPVLVKVLGSLGMILVMTRFCKYLAVSIAVGTLLLGFWCGHSLPEMLEIAWARFWSVDNFLLLFVIFQVIALSSQMAETGIMPDLVDAVRARVSPRGSMAVLPAVIGLLPMPGGALFSAPLVDSCDVNGTIHPRLKAQTNYYYRHIWELWWPLYPGVILAMSITRLQPWHFMIFGVPLGLCAVVAGYFFLLKRIEFDPVEYESTVRPKPQEGFFSLVAPIIVIVVCYALMKGGYMVAEKKMAGVPPLNKYVPMMFGIFAAMLYLSRKRPLEAGAWKRILISKRTLSLAVVVAIVRIYGAIIESPLPSGVELVEQMRTEMDAWGIPMLAVLMVIPFVSGLTTGLAVGFIGASFPIVMNLVGQDAAASVMLPATALAYSFGYAGMLLSPLHVCLIVTSEHFRTPILRNIAGLVKPALIVMVAAFLLYLLLGAVTGASAI